MKKLMYALLLLSVIVSCRTLKPQGLYLFSLSDYDVNKGKPVFIWVNTVNELDSLLLIQGIQVSRLDTIVESDYPVFDSQYCNKYIYIEKPYKNRNLTVWEDANNKFWFKWKENLNDEEKQAIEKMYGK